MNGRPAGRRVVIRCDEIRLDDKGATPLALTIHELATNSAKYGAGLSSERLRPSLSRMLEGRKSSASCRPVLVRRMAS